MYKRIRDLREDKDLSQKEIAALLNISQSTYSRYESGFLDIPSEILISLSKLYGVSTDYILGLSDWGDSLWIHFQKIYICWKDSEIRFLQKTVFPAEKRSGEAAFVKNALKNPPLPEITATVLPVLFITKVR